MAKIIAIHGATGTQGGSVVKSLLKSDWKVRAITRNASGASAKSLVDAGVEVVTADFDDESSLVRAYEGVEAIFLVTNFWEHLFTGKTASESGEAEARQALTAIKSADKTPTLKHFIWSTIPGNAEGQSKRIAVHHFDPKAQLDVKIRKEFPELAAKTTYLYVGYYANNIINFPFANFFTLPMSFGKYIWLSPVPGSTILPSAGDTSINVGIFTKAILAQPEKTLTKYVSALADTPTQTEVVEFWEAVTGKQAAFLEINASDYVKAFGAPGEEFYLNLKAFHENPRWAYDNDPLNAKDLGVENQLVGTKAYLESVKEQLV